MKFDWLEIYWTDTYKVGHRSMLPVGSTLMQSNFTPRSGKNSNCPNDGKIVSFGQQLLVRKLKEDWDSNFFKHPIEHIDQFGADMGMLLGWDHPIDVTHFKDLHNLQYLPIEIKAIEEGNLIPYKVPLYTIVNTQPLGNQVFDWIVNYLETILSAEAWQAPTSATTAYSLRKMGLEWAKKTDPDNLWFVDYQFHNFAMRGMDGKSSIVNSGLGFATSSRGSDTLPVIPAARKYYDEPITTVPINSVIASEHAIMCTLTGFFLQVKKGTWEKIGELEVETFRYLLRTFPTGILSLVSDTWDLWRVIVDYCVILKDEIMAREGKLVIRPDSGDPVDIICGIIVPEFAVFEEAEYYFGGRLADGKNIFKVDGKHYDVLKHGGQEFKYVEYTMTPADYGVIELLWNIFGGDKSATGYKRLHSCIGAIYGDSINYRRAFQIFQRLELKGFASTNIVLGVGSYSLQMVTRDTHGFKEIEASPAIA